MISTTSSTREVKRVFLLANAFKEVFRVSRAYSPAELDERYLQIIEQLERLEETEIDYRITDKTRLKRYDSLVWLKGTKGLSRMGVWPKMQGLDILLTTGNVSDTTRGVKKVLEGKSGLVVPEKFKRKLSSVRRNLDFIHSHFPLILFPGGTVREDEYNRWARKSNEPICKIFDYDIDDGCNRAVAYSLEGIKGAEAYFAYRI